MMKLPIYPASIPISLEIKDVLTPVLETAMDGVSEFTFANLFLFRVRYDYQISLDANGVLIVRGTLNGKKFFETPSGVPQKEVLQELLTNNDYWKCIPKSIMVNNPNLAAEFGIEITEDRDNFDYLYLREELAALSGKKFHKKRNLSNAFTLAYPQNNTLPLTKELIPHAIAILDRWKEDKGAAGDYIASREAIELADELGLSGEILYVRGVPAAYCLGESLASRGSVKYQETT